MEKLFNIKMVTIPILDIYAIGCGMYMGYSHKNGVDINNEFYTLSPLIASIGITYGSLKFFEKNYSKFKNIDINDSSLSFKDKSGNKINLNDMTLEEKIEFENKYNPSMKKIEEKIYTNGKNKFIFQNSTKTSIEIAIGYLIGRAFF